MLVGFVFILLFVVSCVYLWSCWVKLVNNGSGPLMSGTLPFLGYTHKLIGNTETLWNAFTALSKHSLENDGFSRAIICFKNYYVVTEPEDLLTVGNNCVSKHFAFDFAKVWLGNGLITAPVPIWKEHRKLLSPCFSLQILHGYLTVFNKQGQNIAVELAKEVDNGLVNVNYYFRNAAMNSLSYTLLGISETEKTGIFSKYIKAADETMEMIVMRFQNAWLHSDFIYKVLGFKKKQTELIKTLTKLPDLVIEMKKKEVEESSQDLKYSNKDNNNSFLDRLLRYKENGTLTEREMKEEVDTMLVAGVDTTSWVMTYVCVVLGSHPQVQQKVYEELCEVLGDSKNDVEKEDLQKLVYLEAVIKETMRLYPVAPLSLRTVDSGFKIRNHYFRPGDHIILSFYGASRHASWGPDASQFRPERWLEGKTPSIYAGFGLGKRNCIGKTFALMSMKVLLSHILRRYQVTGDITKLKFKVDYVNKAASGYFVALTERRKRTNVLRARD